MLGKFFAKRKRERTAEATVMELEVWKRNRHLIWIFAVVSSIFTYASVSSYYKAKIRMLEQELEQIKRIESTVNGSNINLNSIIKPSIKDGGGK